MIVTINDELSLERTHNNHAEPLFFAVDNNRDHLSKFLPWVANMQTVNDFKNYINICESLNRIKKEVSFVIIYKEELVGRIGINHIDLQNKNAAIGYWLIKKAEGNGIITTACKKLISYGFTNLDLNRIEIKAATENLKSQAIPQKLNFTYEGILRQAELVNNEFLDLKLYSLLKNEWKKESEMDC
ncbi:MAG: GNAT family protein [Ginsengibacter sp.]